MFVSSQNLPGLESSVVAGLAASGSPCLCSSPPVVVSLIMWKSRMIDLCLLPEPTNEENEGADEEQKDEHQ